MIIGVLVVAVTFLLIDKFALRDTAPETVASTDRSVAVLPFVAMSRGEDDEYFADGLTEEILNSLARVPELLVTARTSSFHFKGQDVPVPEIADKLGMAHVVEGSVRREGERLRVTAQLIRAADGFHLWSENYDRETADRFGVQTDIAEKIASALGGFRSDLDRAVLTGDWRPMHDILEEYAQLAECPTAAWLNANTLRHSNGKATSNRRSNSPNKRLTPWTTAYSGYRYSIPTSEQVASRTPSTCWASSTGSDRRWPIASRPRSTPSRMATSP
jgi:TolB-like protein